MNLNSTALFNLCSHLPNKLGGCESPAGVEQYLYALADFVRELEWEFANELLDHIGWSPAQEQIEVSPDLRVISACDLSSHWVCTDMAPAQPRLSHAIFSWQWQAPEPPIPPFHLSHWRMYVHWDCAPVQTASAKLGYVSTRKAALPDPCDLIAFASANGHVPAPRPTVPARGRRS